MWPLYSFHTEADGTCHILLANDFLSEDFVELTNEMFENLVSETDIEWIKVEFQSATEGIICNNVDKYLQYQTTPIQEMSKGDLMVVFKR